MSCYEGIACLPIHLILLRVIYVKTNELILFICPEINLEQLRSSLFLHYKFLYSGFIIKKLNKHDKFYLRFHNPNFPKSRSSRPNFCRILVQVILDNAFIQLNKRWKYIYLRIHEICSTIVHL
jgi:hypothetical protein